MSRKCSVFQKHVKHVNLPFSSETVRFFPGCNKRPVNAVLYLNWHQINFQIESSAPDWSASAMLLLLFGFEATFNKLSFLQEQFWFKVPFFLRAVARPSNMYSREARNITFQGKILLWCFRWGYGGEMFICPGGLFSFNHLYLSESSVLHIIKYSSRNSQVILSSFFKSCVQSLGLNHSVTVYLTCTLMNYRGQYIKPATWTWGRDDLSKV